MHEMNEAKTNILKHNTIYDIFLLPNECSGENLHRLGYFFSQAKTFCIYALLNAASDSREMEKTAFYNIMKCESSMGICREKKK